MSNSMAQALVVGLTAERSGNLNGICVVRFMLLFASQTAPAVPL